MKRAGRETIGQRKGWCHWSKFGLTIEQGVLDIQTCFGREAPLVVEIGFGMGDSLLEMALNEPDKNFIGIEVHRPGVGALLRKIDEKQLDNLRVYCDDAIQVWNHCFLELSISRVQIYFPDPWHKRKHNKRRLIKPCFIEALTKKVKLGGLIHIATDWSEYADEIRSLFERSGDWADAKEVLTNHLTAMPCRPQTKFERRGKNLGYLIQDLYFLKEFK